MSEISGKAQSILLQVAFKAAVDMGVPNEEQTRSNYELLIKLHKDYGINPDDVPWSNKPKGQSNSNTKPKASAADKIEQLPDGAKVFSLNGTQWVDYRDVKDSGGVNAKFPDFKTLQYQKDGGSVWLYSQTGEPNAEAADLVAAAETAVF